MVERWDGGLCGSGQGGVVPVCGPGIDTRNQQPDSALVGLAGPWRGVSPPKPDGHWHGVDSCKPGPD